MVLYRLVTNVDESFGAEDIYLPDPDIVLDEKALLRLCAIGNTEEEILDVE